MQKVCLFDQTFAEKYTTKHSNQEPDQGPALVHHIFAN